jgi:hypothetical protein
MCDGEVKRVQCKSKGKICACSGKHVNMGSIVTLDTILGSPSWLTYDKVVVPQYFVYLRATL